MTEDLKSTILELIKANVLKREMSTSEVVKYLDSKKYHRRALYKDDLKLKLGAKRTGAGVHFVFDTIKVIEFKINKLFFLVFIHFIIFEQIIEH